MHQSSLLITFHFLLSSNAIVSSPTQYGCSVWSNLSKHFKQFFLHIYINSDLLSSPYFSHCLFSVGFFQSHDNSILLLNSPTLFVSIICMYECQRKTYITGFDCCVIIINTVSLIYSLLSYCYCTMRSYKTLLKFTIVCFTFIFQAYQTLSLPAINGKVSSQSIIYFCLSFEWELSMTREQVSTIIHLQNLIYNIQNRLKVFRLYFIFCVSTLVTDQSREMSVSILLFT